MVDEVDEQVDCKVVFESNPTTFKVDVAMWLGWALPAIPCSSGTNTKESGILPVMLRRDTVKIIM